MESTTARRLEIRRVSLDSIHPDPANARTHSAANLAAITASLQRFGQAEPLVVQAGTSRLIAGHGRLEAMQQLGWTEADIVELEVESIDAAALAIALNRSSELASWDEAALAQILARLQAEDSLAGTGYSAEEVATLMASARTANAPVIADPDAVPEPPAVPVARLGDMWILGEHRLLCGDSTNLADVRRVMGGERAALCATDSPYLVDYTGERPNDSGKDWSATYREVEIKDAAGFFRATFTNILAVLGDRAAVYAWHAHKRSGLIQRTWEELGILDHQQVVWVKPAAVFGRVYWHFRHEVCMMGWRQGSKPEHDGQHEFDSVWEVDWAGKARIQSAHPTSKPVELFARPMRKHTKPGDVCFEPFSGSGSQIIAAEQLGRRCYAVEISPTFVDVGIQRWQTASGEPAVLDGDGRTFDEVRAERTEVPSP